MIGTKLGPYEIIEELGKGGMATVYRAYHPHMERYVAVKVIRRSIVEEATARERFQREARIIARLEHPHLLPIYDFDGAHDPPYIVMRYLEGGTLKEALGGRRLPFGEITYLLRQVGSSPVMALGAEFRAVKTRPRPFGVFAGSFAVVLVLLWAFVPHYWRLETTNGPGGLTVGATPEGHPWIGARDPVLVIEEFSDYQCPHCRKGHHEIRRLLQNHPEDVRLVHRHFPLDHHCNARVNKPFHLNACTYARMANCAGRQDAFWQANDFARSSLEGRSIYDFDTSETIVELIYERQLRAIHEDLKFSAQWQRFDPPGTGESLFDFFPNNSSLAIGLRWDM